MGRRKTAIHKSVVSPAPALVPGLHPAPVNPPLPCLGRAVWCWAARLRSAVPGGVRISIKIKLELEIFFTDGATEHENEANVVELDETIETPETANEPGLNIPAMHNIVGGVPAAPVPLMGSLRGVVGHNAP